MSAAPYSKDRVRPRSCGHLIPLAFQQRYAWEDYSQNGPLNERRCEASLRIVGELKLDLLRDCLDILIARHEALRTRIVLVGKAAMQEVLPLRESRLEAVDLTGFATQRTLAGEVEQLTSEFLYQKVDYLTDPIFSCKLLKLSDIEHILLIGIDHIITDGLSSSIVSTELANLYRQAELKAQPSLPGGILQYGDYAIWQLDGLEHWKTRHNAYWQEQARRMSWAELPYDGIAPEHAPLRWRMNEFSLGAELSVRLRTIAATRRMMLPLVALGITISALSRWCGQSEWAVGMVIHGRHGHPELASTVGEMVSLLPLRLSVREDDCLLQNIKEIHAEYSAALAHQDYGRFAGCKMPWELLPTLFNWIPERFARRPRSRPDLRSAGAEMTPFSLYQTRGELFSPRRRLDIRVLADAEDRERGIVVGIGHQDDVFTHHALSKLCESIRMLAASFAIDQFTKPTSSSGGL